MLNRNKVIREKIRLNTSKDRIRRSCNQMIKILVVGQTPPPFGGQAVMVQKMLEGKYNNVRLYHIRMKFSKEMNKVGKPSLFKIFELIRIIGSIIIARFRFKAVILYYPPAGPNIIPVLRDIAILISTKYLFKRIILHFHAGGVSGIYEKSSFLMQFLFKWAYFYPDVAISLSEFSPPDADVVRAKKRFVVPNGIEDRSFSWGDIGNARGGQKEVSNILFVGVLSKAKGVTVFLEACNILLGKGLPFRGLMVGKFESDEFEEQVRHYVRTNSLDDNIQFTGVLEGRQKWQNYASADIFCFPTFFDSENLSVVIIEAMSFGLPVVTTYWRGIPALVENGKSGFLVPPKDSQSLAEKLKVLISDEGMRKKMGHRGRSIYLEKFTIQKYHHNMEKVFETMAALD